MAILYLIVFSTLAITGYYFLANKLGFTQSLHWASGQAAADFFMQDYDLGELAPHVVTHSCLCNDKQTALLRIDSNQAIGVVYSHGNRWVSYLLKPEVIQSHHADTEYLTLTLNDYALPKIHLHFPNECTRKQWQEYIFNPLAAPSE